MTSVTKEYENLPKFQDGRIDYTDSQSAPVLACIIECSGKLLLVKRSNSVDSHRNKWNVVTGYIDNPAISMMEHAMIEIEEELGVGKEYIEEIKIGKRYRYFDKDLRKTWFVFPVLVRLGNRPEIRLNDENTDFTWTKPENVADYDIVPDVPEAIGRVIQ